MVMNSGPSILRDISSLEKNGIFSWGGRTRNKHEEEHYISHELQNGRNLNDKDKEEEEEVVVVNVELKSRSVGGVVLASRKNSTLTGSTSDSDEDDSVDTPILSADAAAAAAAVAAAVVPDWESDMNEIEGGGVRDSPEEEEEDDDEIMKWGLRHHQQQQSRQRTGLNTSEVSEGRSNVRKKTKATKARGRSKSTANDAVVVEGTPGLLTWNELERNPHMLQRVTANTGNHHRSSSSSSSSKKSQKHFPEDTPKEEDTSLEDFRSKASSSSLSIHRRRRDKKKQQQQKKKKIPLLDKVPDQTTTAYDTATNIDEKSTQRSSFSHVSLASHTSSSLGFLGLSSVAAEDDYIADLRYRSLSFLRDDVDTQHSSGEYDDDDNDDNPSSSSSSKINAEKSLSNPGTTIKRVKWMKRIQENQPNSTQHPHNSNILKHHHQQQQHSHSIGTMISHDQIATSERTTSNHDTSPPPSPSPPSSNTTGNKPRRGSGGSGGGGGVGKAIRSLLIKKQKKGNTIMESESVAASSSSIPGNNNDNEYDNDEQYDDNDDGSSCFDDHRLERCVLTSLRLTEDRIDLKVESGKSSKRQRGYLIGNDKMDGTVWMKIPSDGGQ